MNFYEKNPDFVRTELSESSRVYRTGRETRQTIKRTELSIEQQMQNKQTTAHSIQQMAMPVTVASKQKVLELSQS